MVRAHVIFQGKVQGVGFRFTAQRMAQSQKLTGWVKNLSNGNVELIAEGPRDRVEHLLFKLDSHFTITKKDIDWLPARSQFSDFTVAY